MLASSDAAVTGLRLHARREYSQIAGVVRDQHGGPVPDAKVVATSAARPRPNFDQFLSLPHATTDAHGRFILKVIAGVDYSMRARSVSGAEAQIGPVKAGAEQLNLRLRSSP